MATSPRYGDAIINDGVNISTANPNRDGTGTLGTLHTAAGSGSRIEEIDIKARATTTAGMIRLFLHDGTNFRFWREVLVSAVTPSATVAAFESQLTGLGLKLKPDWSIRVATEKAESFDVTISDGVSYT